MVPGPAVPTSPGDLTCKTLDPTPDLANQKLWSWDPALCVLTSPSDESGRYLNFETHGSREFPLVKTEANVRCYNLFPPTSGTWHSDILGGTLENLHYPEPPKRLAHSFLESIEELLLKIWKSTDWGRWQDQDSACGLLGKCLPSLSGHEGNNQD